MINPPGNLPRQEIVKTSHLIPKDSPQTKGKPAMRYGTMGIYDLKELIQELKTGDTKQKLSALEKMAWDLYGEDQNRTMEAMAAALYDNDNFVAVRAARFLALCKKEEGLVGYYP